MRISINWLNDYIDISDLAVNDLAATLTSIGHEVEAMEQVAPFPTTVVTAKILSAQKHPNADSLQVCQVDAGQGQPLKIVCGAPNAREGLYVACALVGTDFGEGFKIKATKIRGESSEGMLCSEKELGISAEHAGILELQGSPALGTSVSQYLKLADTVMTLNITPNRGDCLSYYGVARDLAAKLKRKLKPIDAGVQLDEITKAAPIVIEDEVACPRFVSLPIDSVSAVPSPSWMQKRLVAAGMRPLNLIIDTTNYVMLETGQPIHSYDSRVVEGETFKVRLASKGETLKTLDHQTRTLEEDDVLICDQNKAIGLAGVMGGENSEIKDDTTSIIVEVASFDPVRIRKTSKRLGLKSEASYRFERGTDVGFLVTVAKRTAFLLQKAITEHNAHSADKKPLPKIGKLTDTEKQPVEPSLIALRLDRLKKLMGLPTLSREESINRLEGLGFKLVDKKDDRLLCSVPTWRHDIQRETDLIEEVGRLVGFDKIAYSLPKMDITPTPEHPLIEFLETLRNIVASCGLHEAVLFPFVSAKDIAALKLTDGHPLKNVVKLANPLTDDETHLTSCSVMQLLRALKANRSLGQSSIKIFECGRVFFDIRDAKSTGSFPSWETWTRPSGYLTEKARKDTRVVERSVIAGIIDQPGVEKSWDRAEASASFFDAKSIVSKIAHALGLKNVEFRPLDVREYPFLHPGQSAKVYFKEVLLGYLGEIHPEVLVASGLGIESSPIAFELDCEQLLATKADVKISAKLLSTFPPATRDIALVVDQRVSHAEVCRSIDNFSKRKFLSAYKLFDLYEGGSMSASKKSLAYSLTFQSAERTLKDEEVDTEFQDLLSHLQSSVGAALR